jgi:two-component system CheB/CheR fusion protein
MRALNLPNLSGLRLVVVDDNDDSLDMLDTFLTQCGAEVKAARNVDTALSFIDTDPSIDAVVSDLSMPGRDGLDLIRHLRRHKTRANLAAIALTGFYEHYADARRAGYDVFLQKPVDFDKLCNAIQTAIATKRDVRNAG